MMWQKFFSKFPKTVKEKLVSRAPRVKINPIHKIKINIIKDEQCHLFGVSNISTSGVGILNATMPIEMQPDDEFDCEISLSGIIVRTKLRVARKYSSTTGCIFLENDKEIEAALSTYFSVEFLAIKMREIAEENVKQRSEGKTRWWNGGENCDLVLTYDDLGLINFELTYFGNIICGGRKIKTSFGAIGADSERFSQYKGSNFVSSKQTMTVDLQNTLSKFIISIESLEENLSKSICELIKSNP